MTPKQLESLPEWPPKNRKHPSEPCIHGAKPVHPIAMNVFSKSMWEVRKAGPSESDKTGLHVLSAADIYVQHG